jgi:hypothetical protein
MKQTEGWRPISTLISQTWALLGHEEFDGWYEVGERDALGIWRRRLSMEVLDKVPTHWMPLPEPPGRGRSVQ